VIREQLVKAHPERDGDFRWRGDGVSRIEGLSDAVFGFALTRSSSSSRPSSA
jgi:hypothetical protein